MTNEELAMRIKSGETELMSELWSQVCRFVYKQANKFYVAHEGRCKNMGVEVEDLEQEGYIAIYKAVEGFDPSRNTTFLTYAGLCLKKAFFGICRMNYANWQGNMIRQASSLDAQAYADNEELSIGDTVADNEDIEASIVDKLYLESAGQDLRKAIAELNEGWQEIIYAIYYQETRPVDIARAKGVARTVVSRKHRRALQTLRENESLQAYALT